MVNSCQACHTAVTTVDLDIVIDILCAHVGFLFDVVTLRLHLLLSSILVVDCGGLLLFDIVVTFLRMSFWPPRRLFDIIVHLDLIGHVETLVQSDLEATIVWFLLCDSTLCLCDRVVTIGFWVVHYRAPWLC